MMEEKDIQGNGPRCSYYDEDCEDVEDKFMCWLGHPKTERLPYIPIADGYCPYLESTK